MKIALFYDTRPGRNDGPPLYWRHAFDQLGHTTVRFTSENMPGKEYGKFDLYVWIDWGEDALTGILPYKPIKMNDYHPSMYVASDTHLGFEYRLEKAKEFDHVFCNQKRAVSEFNDKGVEAKWLPHAVEPKAYPSEPTAIKKYDIGFVGFVTFEKRALMLDEILKAFPNFWYGQRLFEEAAEIYRKSRIVFNTAAVDDLNMRVFEVMASGSFLLSEQVPFQGDIMDDREDYVSYDNMDDAIEKAHYYIANPIEREEIALAGHNHVMKNHTYKNRVEEVINIIFSQGNNNKSNKKEIAEHA